MDTTSDSQSKTRPKKRRRLLYLAVIAIVLLLGTSIFFAVAYLQSSHSLATLQKTVATSPVNEASELIKKISDHMTLPDEKPTIATVEDKKKLTSQSFFKNAQNGDKVVMYTKAKKAILYRPSEDKVIEVAYLNIKNTQ
jgi:hypothetical protein